MAAIPVTTGLQLLLDARTITGLADGDKVSAWADQSGQGNNGAQATSANQPTYKTNIFGTNPAVRIVDNTDFVSGSFSAWGTHAGITVISCVNNTPASQVVNSRFFTTASGSLWDYQSHLLYNNSTAGQLYIYQNGALIRTTEGPVLGCSGLSRPTVIGFASDATKVDFLCNGIIGVNQTHTGGLPASPTLWTTGFIKAGAAVPSDGSSFIALQDLHFVAVYSSRLSAANIQLVSNWMLTELGVITAAAGGVQTARGMNGGMRS